MQKGHCFHFTGIQNEICKENINYRELVGGDDFGWAKKMPCFKEKESSVVCEKYRGPTGEELKKDNDRWEEIIKNLTIISPLINELKKKHKKGGAGVSECPICKDGLSWNVSGINGHIRMNCETVGCINFIE